MKVFFSLYKTLAFMVEDNNVFAVPERERLFLAAEIAAGEFWAWIYIPAGTRHDSCSWVVAFRFSVGANKTAKSYSIGHCLSV